MGVDLKKLNTFVRFGGLVIRVQKGHSREGETWEEYRRREKKLLRNIRKDGYIRNHLGEHVPDKDVVSCHGSWVRTSITARKKAFVKSSMKCRYDSGGNSINGSCRVGLFRIFSKDHLEVFFDEKV